MKRIASRFWTVLDRPGDPREEGERLRRAFPWLDEHRRSSCSPAMGGAANSTGSKGERSHEMHRLARELSPKGTPILRAVADDPSRLRARSDARCAQRP